MKNVKLLIFTVFVFLFAFTNVNAQSYTIEGDKVFFDDSRAYISASPHTLTSSGWIEFNITSKVFTGDIDVALGFNLTNVKPNKAELYDPTWSSYTTIGTQRFENVMGVVTVSDTYSCDYGALSNSIHRNVTYNYSFISYNVSNNASINNLVINSSVVCFDSFIDRGNNVYDIYWNTEHSHLNEYKKLGGFTHIAYNYDNLTDWWYNTNIPIVAGQSYKFRVWVDVPFNSQGKYGFAVKPSSQTFSQAVSNGNFYYLDPWWNASWGLCKNITITEGGYTDRVRELVKFNVSGLTMSNRDELRIVSAPCEQGGSVEPFSVRDSDDSTWAYFYITPNVTESSSVVWSVYHDNVGASAPDFGYGDAINWTGSIIENSRLRWVFNSDKADFSAIYYRDIDDTTDLCTSSDINWGECDQVCTWSSATNYDCTGGNDQPITPWTVTTLLNDSFCKEVNVNGKLGNDNGKFLNRTWIMCADSPKYYEVHSVKFTTAVDRMYINTGWHSGALTKLYRYNAVTDTLTNYTAATGALTGNGTTGHTYSTNMTRIRYFDYDNYLPGATTGRYTSAEGNGNYERLDFAPFVAIAPDYTTSGWLGNYEFAWIYSDNGVDTDYILAKTFYEEMTYPLTVTIGSNVIGNDLPVINLVNWVNNKYQNNNSLSVIAWFTDEADSTVSVGFYLDDVLNSTNSTVFNNTNTTFSFIDLTEGNHTYYLNATDDIGDSKISDIYTVVVDSTVPSIVLLSPDNDSYNNIDFNITVNISDVNLAVYVYSWNGGVTNYTTANYTSGSNRTFLVDIASMSEGLNNLSIWVNDSAGNINSDVILFNKDITVPTITNLVATPNCVEVGGSLTLTWDQDDIGSGVSLAYCHYSALYTNNISVSSGSGARGCYATFNETGVWSYGIHVFDTVGNTFSRSGSIDVKADGQCGASSSSSPEGSSSNVIIIENVTGGSYFTVSGTWNEIFFAKPDTSCRTFVINNRIESAESISPTFIIEGDIVPYLLHGDTVTVPNIPIGSSREVELCANTSIVEMCQGSGTCRITITYNNQEQLKEIRFFYPKFFAKLFFEIKNSFDYVLEFPEPRENYPDRLEGFYELIGKVENNQFIGVKIGSIISAILGIGILILIFV